MNLDNLTKRFSSSTENQRKAIFSTLFIAGNKLQTLFDNHIPEVSLKQFMLLSTHLSSWNPPYWQLVSLTSIATSYQYVNMNDRDEWDLGAAGIVGKSYNQKILYSIFLQSCAIMLTRRGMVPTFDSICARAHESLAYRVGGIEIVRAGLHHACHQGNVKGYFEASFFCGYGFSYHGAAAGERADRDHGKTAGND